jgi:GMP synthase-like glutamine amidotransferase
MALHFLVLQHTKWEGPGLFLLDAVNKHNARLTIIKVWQEDIPPLSIFDGLIILGGGPNVDEEDRFPFLTPEKIIIREAIQSDKPCLGICLGHQLIAEALGARIGLNFSPSIGFTKGYLTCDGRNHPCFADFPRIPPLFKWHSRAIMEPVPKELTVLMTSKDCQVEAFSVHERPHILGMQFDNHAAHYSDVAQWIKNDKEWIHRMLGREFDTSQIHKQAKENYHILSQQFDIFFNNFIKLIR